MSYTHGCIVRISIYLLALNVMCWNNRSVIIHHNLEGPREWAVCSLCECCMLYCRAIASPKCSSFSSIRGIHQRRVSIAQSLEVYTVYVSITYEWMKPTKSTSNFPLMVHCMCLCTKHIKPLITWQAFQPKCSNVPSVCWIAVKPALMNSHYANHHYAVYFFLLFFSLHFCLLLLSSRSTFSPFSPRLGSSHYITSSGNLLSDCLVLFRPVVAR